MSTASRAKRPVLAVVVIIIVVVAGLGVYFATQTKPSAPVSSSTSVMSSSTSSAPAPTEFIIDDPSVPESFDPGVSISAVALEITSNVNLPFVFCTSPPGCTTYYPVLATSWDMSPDGLTYTFQLRSDVYFSNGDPWNAYVLWWNVYRNLFMNQPIDGILSMSGLNTTGVTVGDVNALNNPQNDPGSNSTLLSIMQNPHNSVTVISPTEVQFHLATTIAEFMMFMPAGSPWTDTDPYLVEQHGGVTAGQPNSWMSINGGSVGDGPYIVQTYVPNQYTLLTANPKYWAQNITDNFMLHPARIQQILINYKTDELTRALDLETGRVQAGIITFTDIPNVLAANSSLYVPKFGPSGVLEFISLDTEKPPLSNILVRRAIIAAINLTEIRSAIYQGYSVPVVGPNLNGFFGYNDSIKPAEEYNLTKARALLQQAGYPNGAGLPPLTLDYYTSASFVRLSQIVVADLSQIGITVKAQQMSMPTYTAITETCCGTNASYPDLSINTISWVPDIVGYEFTVDQQLGVFFTHNNLRIHALDLKINSELNKTARAIEISQLTEIAQQDAAEVWISQDTDLPVTGTGIGPIVFSSSVTGDGTWNNANYWVLCGLYFSNLYYKSSPPSVTSNYALNTYLLSTDSTSSYRLSSRLSSLHKYL